jgi:DNA-binding IclR family transcriptional regulator
VAITERDSNKSSTALRAFRVLETVANSAEPLGVGDVARLTGLDRATCYRMLRTIEQAGYVVRDRVTKTFRPSRRIISLAKHLLGDDERRTLVSQTLRQISKETGETSHFSEMDGDSAVLTQRSKGTQLVAVDFQIGERYPLHTTSVGKAILAHQDPAAVAAYLERPLTRLTPRTMIDPARLRDELQRVRDSGISYDHGELAEGMNCVAVPVRGAGGAVLAGISISGPDSRFTDAKLKELAASIRAQTDMLTRALAGET